MAATAPRATPERLLAAAVELFAGRGFHGTSIRDIAERAGANVAAGHYHYGSKEGLYLEVLRAQFAEVRAELDRRGVTLSPAALRRMPRRELVELLEARITTMLELLLGPPPAAHGALMLREMCDPTDAMPIIVAEFIAPQTHEMEQLVARLIPDAGRETVTQIVYSIIGQVLFHRFTMPMTLMLRGRSTFPAASPARPRGTSRRSRYTRSTAWSPSAGGAVVGGERRRRRTLLVLPLACLVGCGPARMLTRPEGDGGWSPDRRTEELARRAEAAAVDLEPRTVPRPAATDRQASTAGALTLADALHHAASGNRRVAEARQQLAVARARVAEARGRLLPATTANGRYTFASDDQTVSLHVPEGTGLPLPSSFVLRERDLGTMNGTTTLPLDLSGELWWALASAQAGYRGEAARVWATTLEQDVLVIGAYYTLLEAEKLRDVTRQTIALQKEQLSHASERFDSGRLTKNELLVVQVGLQDAEQELRRRELAIDQARWALNDAIGFPVDSPTVIADVPERPTLPIVTDALRSAYRDNPVLRALVEEQQRLEASATSIARSQLPRFSGGGAIDLSTTDVVDPQVLGSGFVGFSWDLGTDTRIRARLAETRAQAEQNRLRVERELRELEHAVRSTWGAAAERLAALTTAEAAVGQAEENLRIRRQQFDVGRAQSDDVLDAERLLAFQRATLATARYQAQTRRAELQALMGQPVADLLADGR